MSESIKQNSSTSIGGGALARTKSVSSAAIIRTYSGNFHRKNTRKTADILLEIREKLGDEMKSIKSLAPVESGGPIAVAKKLLSSVPAGGFSVKRIEKKFNKLDAAFGELALEQILMGDREKEKTVKKTYESLCPTFFKIGKCLNGPKCNCAHRISDLGKTYLPLEWVSMFKTNTQRLQSANPDVKFRRSYNEESVNIDKIINTKGQTLLLEACEAGITKVLLQKGADANVLDWKGYTALAYALKKDNFELAYTLIKLAQPKIDPDQYVEKLKATYLLFSIKQCSVEIIKLLIDAGGDVNSTDKETNRNGLVFAMNRLDESIVKLLITKGCDVNNLDKLKQDPLKTAIELQNLTFIKLLLKAGASTSNSKKRANLLLMMSCDFGDPDLFASLVEKGVAWGEGDPNGNNVAMRAYLANQTEMCKKLLEDYGFVEQINRKNKFGDTLLLLTIKAEDIKMVEYLLRNFPEKIQTELRNSLGKTALTLACELNNTLITLELLPRTNSIQLNMSDGQKFTPLHWAVKNHNIVIISNLLKCAQLDTTFRDMLEMTPYDYAGSDVVRFMIYKHQQEHRGVDVEERIARDIQRISAAKTRSLKAQTS